MTPELIKDFFEKLKTKDIYCWGSGKYFRNHSLPFLRRSGLINNLKGFIEPGKRKKGSAIEAIAGVTDHVDTIDKAQLMQLPEEKAIVFITVTGYKEVLKQLQNDPKLAHVNAVPSMFLEALYEDMLMLSAPKPPINFRKNKEETIPRIIHAFWFSDRAGYPEGDHTLSEKENTCESSSLQLPERYRKCLDSWKKYAPDFEIKIWDQTNYRADHCLFFEQAIEHKQWAFASDYARADVLRRFGGIYMDLDVEMLRPIEDLLYNDAYMSFESLDRIECGSGMGTKPGNMILDEICKDYESRPFIKENGEFDMSTCPVRFTKIIEKHGLLKNGGFQTVEDITIYPFEVLSGKSFDTGIIYTTELSYTIHHHNGSWVPGAAQRAMDDRYDGIDTYLKAL